MRISIGHPEDQGGDPFFIKNSTGTAPKMDKEVEKMLQGVAQKWKQKTSSENTFHDATLSFDFAVRNSIFMTNDALDAKQAKVLRKWLELL